MGLEVLPSSGAKGADLNMHVSLTTDPLGRVATGQPSLGENLRLWIIGKLDTGCRRSGSAPAQFLRTEHVSSKSSLTKHPK